jgi:alkylation response protein AidB-like acyl-CoA dehydrogenase
MAVAKQARVAAQVLDPIGCGTVAGAKRSRRVRATRPARRHTEARARRDSRERVAALSYPTRTRRTGCFLANDLPRRCAIVSQADASLGQLFGFHHVICATCRLFGAPEQWQIALLSKAVLARRLVLGQHAQPARPPPGRCITLPAALRLRGVKSYTTGASDSDMLLVSAIDDETERLVVAALPTRRRAGIEVYDDWDNIGQRLTDSGSTVVRRRVLWTRAKYSGRRARSGSTFATLRSCIAQLTFVNVYIGIAHGALAEAEARTRVPARARGPARASSMRATIRTCSSISGHICGSSSSPPRDCRPGRANCTARRVELGRGRAHAGAARRSRTDDRRREGRVVARGARHLSADLRGDRSRGDRRPTGTSTASGATRGR